MADFAVITGCEKGVRREGIIFDTVDEVVAALRVYGTGDLKAGGEQTKVAVILEALNLRTPKSKHVEDIIRDAERELNKNNHFSRNYDGGEAGTPFFRTVVSAMPVDGKYVLTIGAAGGRAPTFALAERLDKPMGVEAAYAKLTLSTDDSGGYVISPAELLGPLFGNGVLKEDCLTHKYNGVVTKFCESRGRYGGDHRFEYMGEVFYLQLSLEGEGTVRDVAQGGIIIGRAVEMRKRFDEEAHCIKEDEVRTSLAMVFDVWASETIKFINRDHPLLGEYEYEITQRRIVNPVILPEGIRALRTARDYIASLVFPQSDKVTELPGEYQTKR